MNIIGTFVDGEEKGIGEFYHDEDVDFIVNAPNDMRRLLDEVERLRKENAMLKSQKVRQLANDICDRNNKGMQKLSSE
jgi:hypothetical protein